MTALSHKPVKRKTSAFILQLSVSICDEKRFFLTRIVRMNADERSCVCVHHCDRPAMLSTHPAAYAAGVPSLKAHRIDRV